MLRYDITVNVREGEGRKKAIANAIEHVMEWEPRKFKEFTFPDEGLIVAVYPDKNERQRVFVADLTYEPEED